MHLRAGSSLRRRGEPTGRWGRLVVPALLLLALVLGGATARVRCPAPPDAGSPAAAAASPFTDPAPPQSVRAEDSTYLTFPEWYIVYSAQEYARALEVSPPSAFPYFRSIGQYWCSYHTVFDWSQRRYGFSPGNHLMLMVIGTSYTLEYAVKGVYESTTGRVMEWIGGDQTEEDALGRQVAREYGDFLVHTPWYEFPFADRLGTLWRDTSWWGENPIRKLERRLALTLELGVKAAYGWLIGLATSAIYEEYEQRTLAWMDAVPPDTLAQVPGARLERQVDAGSQLVALPRFREFDAAVLGLARQGAMFRAMAGNDEIMLTAIGPEAWQPAATMGQLLFQQRILTEPGRKRIGLNVPVAALSRTLTTLEAQGLQIEHLYDY